MRKTKKRGFGGWGTRLTTDVIPKSAQVHLGQARSSVQQNYLRAQSSGRPDVALVCKKVMRRIERLQAFVAKCNKRPE